MIKKSRCGWCMTGDHEHCVIAVLCGETRSKSEKVATGPYVWRCPCEELGCRNGETKCVDCQRVGVEIVKDRCVDNEGCRRFRRYPGKVRQPPVREVRV